MRFIVRPHHSAHWVGRTIRHNHWIPEHPGTPGR